MIFQNSSGTPPSGQDAADYAADIENPDFPVLADPSEQVVAATEYDGTTLPGTCILSPRMELLHCDVGEVDDELFDIIRAHATESE